MSKVITIESCEQCPHHKVRKVYTPDPFDNIREIYCNKVEEWVHAYLGYSDKSDIPDECPLEEMIWKRKL